MYIYKLIKKKNNFDLLFFGCELCCELCLILAYLFNVFNLIIYKLFIFFYYKNQSK